MKLTTRISRLIAATLMVTALALTAPLAVKCADNYSLVGTWIVWAEILPGVRVPSLHTYHQDGTVTTSDTLMFGGLPGVPIRSTPLHGVWEKTGPTAFTTTNIFLVYDAASSVLIGFGRARAEISFNGREIDSGIVHVDFLQCQSPVACPDPTAPDAAWAPFPGFPSSFKATATRLTLTPPQF